MIECGKYYDLLDDFAKSVKALNGCAETGFTVNELRKKMHKLIPAFLALCEEDTPKLKIKKQIQNKNNLEVRDGWGICPECGKKCIRVQDDTVLVKYPMFCKVCKKEIIVNWKCRE